MKFYIAARTALREEVIEIYEKIKERGHEISYDWMEVWEKLGLRRPYEKQSKIAKLHVEKVIAAIKTSDVFIMISDKEGTDMYGELASAISFNFMNQKPKIFILGEYSSNSIFPFHPSINRRKTIEGVLEEVGF